MSEEHEHEFIAATFSVCRQCRKTPPEVKLQAKVAELEKRLEQVGDELEGMVSAGMVETHRRLNSEAECEGLEEKVAGLEKKCAEQDQIIVSAGFRAAGGTAELEAKVAELDKAYNREADKAFNLANAVIAEVKTSRELEAKLAIADKALDLLLQAFDPTHESACPQECFNTSDGHGHELQEGAKIQAKAALEEIRAQK